MPEIGDLQHRVTIQIVEETVDSVGEIIQSWTDVATRWAQIEPLSGREIEQYKSTQASVSHKVTLRHFPGLSFTNRFMTGDRVFNIASVINLNEADVWNVVVCWEAVTG